MLAYVLLASGQSSRFHGNKLLTDFDGKPLYTWAMRAVPRELFGRVVVVTAYDSIQETAEAEGMEVIRNPRPEDGISGSVRLGLEAAGDADGCMFCVCDQPYLSSASIRRLVRSFQGGISALGFGGRKGNPVLFDRAYFPELRKLRGDKGGGAVLRKHVGELHVTETECAVELMDIDTLRDFSGLQRIRNLILTGSREGLEAVETLRRELGDNGPPCFLSDTRGRPQEEGFGWREALDAEMPAIGFSEAEILPFEIRARQDTLVVRIEPGRGEEAQSALNRFLRANFRGKPGYL